VLRIYLNQDLSNAAATLSVDFVRTATAVPTAFVLVSVGCTTWEILSLDDPAIWLLPTPNITALNATAISTLIWTIWQCQEAAIPTEWWPWQCGWSWKTACRTGQHPGIYGVTTGSLCLGLRFRTGSRQRGKKAESSIQTQYLDDALADFSGYIAADELYDGPFCVLFIVDNHRFRRLYYQVLDHDPTNEDITRLFQRLKQILDARGLTVRGITTDGSQLYPEAIQTVFGKVRHQICEFHVIKEIIKAILKAIAQARKQLKRQKTSSSPGRPSGTKAKRLAQNNKRIQSKIAGLFEHRHLFVKHTLTVKEKKVLRRITYIKGVPHLQALRSIMDEVYRLFDRRCRMDTALEKLARLRQRIRRFGRLAKVLKKLFSPNLEKSLTFLDDSLLPATSNAVERTNRRHRKMQKSIYRVRTCEHISQRIAVDMQRDIYICRRICTIKALHRSRTGEMRKTG